MFGPCLPIVGGGDDLPGAEEIGGDFGQEARGFLPAVAAAVNGRAEVLVDGGIRRGTDVIKALALGANAVLLGRPILWGLATAGEAGVCHVLELLRSELETDLALCGRAGPREVDGTLIVPAKTALAR